jgi:hypothetical protein
MTYRKPPLLDWTKITEWCDVIIDAALAKFAPKRDRAWWLSQNSDEKYWDVHYWYEPMKPGNK